MGFFLRGVVYGFALSLGQALFKKVQDRLGLAEKPTAQPDVTQNAAPAPNAES
jgi:hypothetical protein